MKNLTIFLDSLSKWWLILVFLVSMVVMWTNLQNQVSLNSKNIDLLTAKDLVITANENQIQVQLSQIQTDIQWIKTTLTQATVTIIK